MEMLLQKKGFNVTAVQLPLTSRDDGATTALRSRETPWRPDRAPRYSSAKEVADFITAAAESAGTQQLHAGQE
ncbi:MAG TPA: hypothetical protein VMR62_12740 [Bryobacteraceae bacterium]|jgi:hypothetical protein|nr:hypothetical protein [Bryobacteraceae bacterium]